MSIHTKDLIWRLFLNSFYEPFKRLVGIKIYGPTFLMSIFFARMAVSVCFRKTAGFQSFLDITFATNILFTYLYAVMLQRGKSNKSL